MTCVCVSDIGWFAGTGASCIYPLLGKKVNGWQFLATETDELSTATAIDNISRNGLQNSITGETCECEGVGVMLGS